MKKVSFTEVMHQWGGKAIVRENGELKEVDLGVAQSSLKLKESGAKNLFNAPEGTIAIEVTKLTDVTTTYEMSAEDFKMVARVPEVSKEEKPVTDEEVIDHDKLREEQ
jgi:hypothetical protein